MSDYNDEVVLQLTNLRKTYTNKYNVSTLALDGVSLSLHKGEVLGISLPQFFPVLDGTHLIYSTYRDIRNGLEVLVVACLCAESCSDEQDCKNGNDLFHWQLLINY